MVRRVARAGIAPGRGAGRERRAVPAVVAAAGLLVEAKRVIDLRQVHVLPWWASGPKTLTLKVAPLFLAALDWMKASPFTLTPFRRFWAHGRQ